jgi:hypothetical protein
MLSEGHGLLQGLSIPSPWLKMIHLSGQIYKKLTPGQKIKLVEMGVLPPNFEKELLFVFNTYLPQEHQKLSLQAVLEKRKSETKGFPYKEYHDILMMIKPEEITKEYNSYIAFKKKLNDLMKKYHPEINISLLASKHPNYSYFYDEWKKIHKILVEPKK